MFCFILQLFLCVPLHEARTHAQTNVTLRTQCVYLGAYHWFLTSTVGTPQLLVTSGAFNKGCVVQVVSADVFSSLDAVWPYCSSPPPVYADSGDGTVPLKELEGDVVDELPEHELWFEWIGSSTKPRIVCVQHG